MHRRTFLNTGLAAAAAYAAGERPALIAAENDKPTPLADRLCLFTDHLDDSGYSYTDVAKMLAPLKIAGPDLTVRGGGLVPPERVEQELPKAAAALAEQGMRIPMVSTSLTSAKDPTARPMLAAMARLGIRYYKLGYYHYHDVAKWEAEIDSHRKELATLLELGRADRICAGLHNHAGATIGGAVWDAWEMLRPLDAAEVGFYFDPAHATLEGAKHTWKLNLQRIAPRLVMVALKDFVWEKTSRGWQTRWCPLGEGLVNWDEFFAQLVRIPFAGPISLHIEYDPGGKTPAERIDNNLAAAQRDLAFVRKHLAKVSGGK